MKLSATKMMLAFGVTAFSAVALINCGADDNGSGNSNLGEIPGTVDLGNFNLSCAGQSGGQQSQKQVPFQQQQQSGCTPQKFQFQKQVAANYDVNLDCGAKRVVVRNRGQDAKQESIPIQNDGTVKGTFQYQQQVQNDGRGRQVCWVEYQVSFDGKAQCGGAGSTTQPQPTATVTAQPSPTLTILPFPLPPATSRPNTRPTTTIPGSPGTAAGAGGNSLSLKTTIAFQQTTSNELRQIGIEGPVVGPSGTPTQAPSPTQAPGATPSASPSANPFPFPFPTTTLLPQPSGSPSSTPSATPTSSPTQTPTVTAQPSPTGTPVVICVVDNPCPLEATTDLSCGQ